MAKETEVDAMAALLKRMKDPDYARAIMAQAGIKPTDLEENKRDIPAAPKAFAPIMDENGEVDLAKTLTALGEHLAAQTEYVNKRVQYSFDVRDDAAKEDARKRQAVQAEFAELVKEHPDAQKIVQLIDQEWQNGKVELKEAYKLARKKAIEEGILEDKPVKEPKQEQRKDARPTRQPPSFRSQDGDVDEDKLKDKTLSTEEVAAAKLEEILAKDPDALGESVH